ncbi:MAG: MATE family efflux transporter [Clostridia bacterium]|nr:MATE family efflux transporter [Clostridia bacterium]
MSLQKSHRRAFYALLFPVLIENILSQVFLLVDSIMIGQMPGSTPAVAAVGLCGAPINLIICVSGGFFIGTTATVAWHRGAGEEAEARHITWQTMTVALFISLVMTLASYFFAGGITDFVCGDSEAEVLRLAEIYYRINAVGFLFQILTMNISAALRGVGIAKLPMYYNLIGGAVNVGLNYVLIFGALGFPAMGVAGAAIATVISKGISFLIALGCLLLLKSPLRYARGVRLLPSRRLLSRFLPIALTSAAEQVVLQSGATLTAKIISGLPTASLAANQIVQNLEAFAWSSSSACNAASTTLFGQAVAAGDEELGRRYVRLTLGWAMGFAAAEMAIMCLGGSFLARLFSNDASLYPTIVGLLFVSAVSLPAINAHQTISGALRSVGDSVAPLIASLLSLWVFRVGGGFLAVRILDLGVYAYRWTLVLDQTVRCATVSYFYLTGHWRKFLLPGRK